MARMRPHHKTGAPISEAYGPNHAIIAYFVPGFYIMPIIALRFASGTVIAWPDTPLPMKPIGGVYVNGGPIP